MSEIDFIGLVFAVVFFAAFWVCFVYPNSAMRCAVSGKHSFDRYPTPCSRCGANK